jgi:hypothetical protein
VLEVTQQQQSKIKLALKMVETWMELTLAEKLEVRVKWEFEWKLRAKMLEV